MLGAGADDGSYPHRGGGRHRHRLIAMTAAVSLIGALSIVAPSSASAAAPPTATFNPNLLLKGSGSAAEPSIRTDRFGRSFVIAPTGVPAGCKALRVTHDGSASTFLGSPTTRPGAVTATGPSAPRRPLRPSLRRR